MNQHSILESELMYLRKGGNSSDYFQSRKSRDWDTFDKLYERHPLKKYSGYLHSFRLSIQQLLILIKEARDHNGNN